MSQEIFSSIGTEFSLLPANEMERILSDLKNYDTASWDISQASNNAIVSTFSNSTSQQEHRQQLGNVRQTSQLFPVLVSEERIPSANGCIKNVPKDVECEPAHGISYVAAHASGQNSYPSHGAHRCDLCEMSFRNPEELFKHTCKHIDKRFYVCKICQKSFKTEAILKRHLISHSNERPHQCEICRKTFKIKYSLITHNRKKHPEKSPPNVDELHKCYLCEKIFTNREELLSHIRTCMHEKSQLCDGCMKCKPQKF